MGILDRLAKLAGTGTQCVYCGREIAQGNVACPACTTQARDCLPKDCRAGGILHVYKYDDVVRTLIRNLKYNDLPRLAMFAAQRMDELLQNEGIEADLVTFVPVHRERLKSRGYDQSEMIAAHLSMLAGLPFAKLLERVRNTKPQFDLNAAERAQNITGAFQLCAGPETFAGKTILLIDDIYTTGATMGACASLLAPYANVIPFAFSKEYPKEKAPGKFPEA